MTQAEAGLVHLRLVVPRASSREVIALLKGSPAVVNVAVFTAASIKPAGDLVLCDVAREETSAVVEQLRALGLEEQGSISIDSVGTTISAHASRAVEAAAGSPSDAVVWEDVEARTSESAELSLSFMAFMILATSIAAVGILNDSQVLIIGAMVVGPEFGPLAGLCVALVQGRRDLAVRSGKAIAMGFPVAILATLFAVVALRAGGAAPEALTDRARPETFFIAHPDTFSVLVALLAGTAGLLSLSTAKSGAVLGVLISVTTIPAAANVAVAAAYSDAPELWGAAAQLTINLVCIVVAGVVTLAIQRRGFRRRTTTPA